MGNGKRGLAHSKTLARDSQAAFTRIELVAVLLVLSLCAAVMLPALAANRPRSQRVLCANNLRQIGQAFSLWGNDHGDRLPYNVALTDGGTLLHPLAVNPWLHFSWMSNELNSAAILLCPSDTGRPAHDFSADPNGGYIHPNFANAATSYILAHSGASMNLDVISLDRNAGYDFTGDCSLFRRSRAINVSGGGASSIARWTAGLHNFSGNMLRRDGSVEQIGNANFIRSLSSIAGDFSTVHYITPR